MFMNTARDKWKNLEQRFQISNGARKYQVCKMIYETKQNGKPVNEYYTEMKILWEELENLNLSAKHQQDEEHKLFQFLNGLDELNGAIRSQLLMYSTLPSVYEACCVIQQEESQRQTLKPVKEEPETLVMYGKTSPPTCTACGKTGHIKEKCWTVIGYPPWYGGGEGKGRAKEQLGNGGGRSLRGGRGRGRGRMSRRGTKMANYVQNQKGESSQGTKEGARSIGSAIIADQLEQLLKILPPPSKQGGGDTDDIGLPNGDTAVVTHRGEVNLNKDLKLTNVMYVPSFRHNLISVQKLIKENCCEVKFTERF
ncbi:Retrovirus-related Pol polyprotein from transposon RE2 [Bienertia sinuspersici]